MSLKHRRLNSWGRPLALAASLLQAAPAGAQYAPVPGGATPSPLLSPPSLPSMLPGGIPMPALPPAVQQDILQRILDASGSGGGGMAPAPPRPLPPAALPAAPPPAAMAAAVPEPALSHTEAFYAARLDVLLRQFGYDTFSRLSA